MTSAPLAQPARSPLPQKRHTLAAGRISSTQCGQGRRSGVGVRIGSPHAAAQISAIAQPTTVQPTVTLSTVIALRLGCRFAREEVRRDNSNHAKSPAGFGNRFWRDHLRTEHDHADCPEDGDRPQGSAQLGRLKENPD